MTNAHWPEQLIAVALMIVALAAGMYDVWALFSNGGTRTISAVMQLWAGQYPMLPFAFGVLAGHLFWPLKW